MKNISSFIIISLILLAIDFYCWQGVKSLISGLTHRAQIIIRFIYWIYTAFIFSYFLLWRMFNIYINDHTARFIAIVSASILIAKVIWCLFILGDDIRRLVIWIKSYFSNNTAKIDTAEVPISRSKFLNYAGLIMGSAFIGSMMYGIARGAHKYTIQRRKLSIKGLPKAFHGLKIVQISDIHSGSFWSRREVERGVGMIMKESADMVFFTGDLVNDRANEVEPWMGIFGSIKAPLGVYSVLGNHDYGDYVLWNNEEDKMDNLKRMVAIHGEMGWNLLMNEHRIIERDGEKLAILGIENWSAKARFPKYGDLHKAYHGLEDIPVKLLLSHDPSHWRAEVLPKFSDIQAVFSGHTHGFQFGIDSKFYRWSPVKYVYEEWMDLYVEKVNNENRYLYVNRGFGYIGYPGRVGIFPEITVFTLENG